MGERILESAQKRRTTEEAGPTAWPLKMRRERASFKKG